MKTFFVIFHLLIFTIAKMNKKSIPIRVCFRHKSIASCNCFIEQVNKYERHTKGV